MVTGLTRNARHRCGFVLIAFTLALLLILGCVGLAFDIGRMYIARNESQSFCDSAALSAAWMLDGSLDGIAKARTAALATAKRYEFGTTEFDPDRIQVEFAKDPPGAWEANPADPVDYVMVRVRTSADLGMMIMPVITGSFSATIAASATAKQIELPGGAPNSIFPFAPMAIPTPEAGTVPPGSQPANDPFGMVPAQYTEGGATVYQHGGVYTLRGPSNIKDVEDMCPNDATELGAEYRKSWGQPDRGYIWNSNSAKDIKDAILGNVTPPDGSINIGDSITDLCDYCKANGVKQSEVKAIGDRVESDTDSTTRWYKDYIERINSGTGTYGNYQRVVTVPIVTGPCGGTLDVGGTSYGLPCTGEYGPNTVVGFAAFFLLPYEKSNSGPYGLPGSYYSQGGNGPICAEYIGPWNGGGGASAGTGTGNRIAKLVQ